MRVQERRQERGAGCGGAAARVLCGAHGSAGWRKAGDADRPARRSRCAIVTVRPLQFLRSTSSGWTLFANSPAPIPARAEPWSPPPATMADRYVTVAKREEGETYSPRELGWPLLSSHSRLLGRPQRCSCVLAASQLSLGRGNGALRAAASAPPALATRWLTAPCLHCLQVAISPGPGMKPIRPSTWDSCATVSSRCCPLDQSAAHRRQLPGLSTAVPRVVSTP